MRDAGKQYFPQKFDNSKKFLSNVCAKRTGFQSNHICVDKVTKENDLIRLFREKEEERNKEYKVRTKGKFAEATVSNPRDHFIRDIGW